MIQPDQQYDRITQILQSQATPTAQPLGPIQSANAFLSSLNGGNYTDVATKLQDRNLNMARQEQADTVGREMDLLKVFEAKRQAGDAQAEAIGDKIDLFTGGDPEGQALFLKALHEDPEEIDAGNSYQVMTKLARIAKQNGYTSPAMQKKNTMDSVNKAITERLGIAGEPKNVRLNNPGNMKSADGGFQAFGSAQDGMKAMQDDLMIKVSGKSKAMEANFGKGYQPTLSNVISTWAPPSENDTGNYVNFVAQKTGIQPDQILSPMDIKKIIPAMIEMEGGQEAAQYYQPVQTADSGQIMNDGVDELTALQAQLAMASGDQAGAIKILQDAQKKSEPTTDIGKMQRDEQMGLVPAGSTQQLIESKTRQERKEKAESEAAAKATEEADRQAEVTKKVAQTKMKEASDLLKNGGWNVGGLSASASLNLPGKSTDADKLNSIYSTLKSVISLDKLMQMKKASSTGASGFGALSAPELQLLVDSVSSLDTELPIETQKESLKTISQILGYPLPEINGETDHTSMSDDELLRSINGE